MSVKSSGPLQEGGAFRCGLHGDKEFVTTDPAKWREHISQDDKYHSQFGQKPCTMCGTLHKFDDEPAGDAVFCDKCKPKLAKLFSKEPSKSKK